MSHALTLTIYHNGNSTPFHITICVLNSPNWRAIARDVLRRFAHRFGRAHTFKLLFTRQWGKNSILTKSYDSQRNIGLETLRQAILDYIIKTYGISVINRGRYTSGLPPQHIHTSGDMSNVGQTWDVTYSLH